MSSPLDRTSRVADAVTKPTPAAEIFLGAWNQALFDELLPLVPGPHGAAVLACDDETVRAAARRLGVPALGGVSSLVQEIKRAHRINPGNGLKELTRVGSAFRNAHRPRPVPPFLADLCLFVLAASRMSPEETRPTNAYYPSSATSSDCTATRGRSTASGMSSSSSRCLPIGSVTIWGAATAS